MNLKNVVSWLLLGAGFVIAPMAEAVPVTWSLANLIFNDGATASGTFVWDADSRTMNLWNISVTGGSALPNFSYNPTDSSFFSYSAWSSQLTLQFNDNNSNRQLRLTPVSDLTNAGLATDIDLDTAYQSGSLECNNCDPARTITAGAFTAAVQPAAYTPEPAMEGMAAIGLIAVAFTAKKIRRA